MLLKTDSETLRVAKAADKASLSKDRAEVCIVFETFSNTLSLVIAGKVVLLLNVLDNIDVVPFDRDFGIITKTQ